MAEVVLNTPAFSQRYALPDLKRELLASDGTLLYTAELRVASIDLQKVRKYELE